MNQLKTSIASTPRDSTKDAKQNSEAVPPNAPKKIIKRNYIPRFIQSFSTSKKAQGGVSTALPKSFGSPLPKVAPPEMPSRTQINMKDSLPPDYPSTGKLTPTSDTDSMEEHPNSVGRAKSQTLEPPLQRPDLSETRTFTELPLQRPTIVGQRLIFSDATMTIAIDVSGSTTGPVIAEEVKAIQAVCELLNENAKAKAAIIPWDSVCQHGGTRPQSITLDKKSTNLLSKSSAWLLFTDRAISENYVREFSRGICHHGLHGTACVIVLFGYKHYSPMHCNTSIGLSVFSVASDCLFLFHDVDNGNVYIFQSKGIFKKLLPRGRSQIILDSETTWDILPTMRYSELAQIEIPPPAKLPADTIRLQGTRTINLHDIYNDTVDPETATEILDNDDNLKSVLLTTDIRGRNTDVERWVQKQKLSSQDILWVERPDQGSMATRLIAQLLPIMRGEKSPSEKPALQASLRRAHVINWSAFIGRTTVEKEKVTRRAEVIHDAMHRIKFSEKERREGISSPQRMSPVSPGRNRDSRDVSSLSLLRQPRVFESPPSAHGAPSPFEPRRRTTYRVAPRESPSDRSEYSRIYSTTSTPETDILCIPGYRCDSRSPSSVGVQSECPLCGREDTPLAMLLKLPPADYTTPDFIEPNSRFLLPYPFTMGIFPETDIVSSFVCCHDCAYSLVRMKKSPYDEEITSAIPLIPEAIHGRFQEVTFDAIDKAFKKRFERPAIDQVFLAVLYNTLWDLPEGENKELEKEALEWVCKMLALNISLPASLSSSLASGSVSPRGYIPLPLALSQNINGISRGDSALLQYPLPGFLVMISAMVDLNVEPYPGARKLAVFQRFLYLLAENHHQHLAEDSELATAAPQRLLDNSESQDTESPRTNIDTQSGLSELSENKETPDSNTTQVASPEASQESQPNLSALSLTDSRSTYPALSIPAPSLTTTHLLSIEELDTLSLLGPTFSFITDDYSNTIAAFLHVLAREMKVEGGVEVELIVCFDRIMAREPLRDILDGKLCFGEVEVRAVV